MVLSAGFGTRLRPLTDELPKPLVPIAGQPLLLHLVRRLEAAGAQRVVVNAHHLGDKIQEVLGAYGSKVDVNSEKEILGTAGGIAAARGLLGDGWVLVLNGDIHGELPVLALLDAEPALVRLAVSGVLQAGSGTVGVGTRGEVVRLRGEVFGEEVRGADYTGAALLSFEARAALPKVGCLIGDFVLPLLRRGEQVVTADSQAAFIDVGSPGEYLRANLEELRRGAVPPSGLAYREGSLLAGDVVVPPGVELSEVILGEGVQVSGVGLLRQVVAWPGARVEAPLERAVVTSSGVVVRLC